MSTPGDSGYWIEGPTGEDIRSIWRGQPVHVLVVDALLHPRATNLPPHVQTAYIQSAMKVCLLFSSLEQRYTRTTTSIFSSLKAALFFFFSFFFIFLIMKVFARACTDCTEGEIASLVGIIRSRLGVFLQVRAALFVEMLHRLSAKSGHRLCYSRCYTALAIIDHNACSRKHFTLQPSHPCNLHSVLLPHRV